MESVSLVREITERMLHYLFQQYKYENLADAINYARKQK
jgi:hypothetical protein